jgi:predicted O-methyltransferase YrrM
MILAVPAIIAGFVTTQADLRRRRLHLTPRSGWHPLTFLDLVSAAFAAGVVVAFVTLLIGIAINKGFVPLRSPEIFGVLASIASFLFLWHEGLRQIQFQRPRGIIFAEALILGGASVVAGAFLFRSTSSAATGSTTVVLCASSIVFGCVMLALIVPPFVKKGAEYHRILEHVQEQGESVQAEYTPPTPECPNPQLWHMADSQSTEMEVLDFLKALVTTIKPRLIVETGTFIGYGAIALAQGLKANGFGRLITIEFDPAIYAKAKERIASAGLADWVEARNESSTETEIDGTIDLLFSDSALAIREEEIRRLLPQVNPQGLIAIHDASSHFKVVREAALRMEAEGLLSVVLLPTPRGLVLAQKRDSRS